MGFEGLKEYKAEKFEDKGVFEPFKGEFICAFEKLMVEEYDGDSEYWTKGDDILKYTLVITRNLGIDDAYVGRKLFKSYNLADERKHPNTGKTSIQQVADLFFTLEQEFKDKEELQASIEVLVTKFVRLKTWFYKNAKGENIQMHKISCIADEPDELTNASMTIDKPAF